MNDVLQNVMTFINQNTYLLIGICIFLILVLIGYLIDNSVKSKRVRKDIKSKDQVPENIKNAIIEEAEANKEFNEVKVEQQVNEPIVLEESPVVESEQVIEPTVQLEEPLNLDSSINFDSSINLDSSVNFDSSFDLGVQEPISSEPVQEQSMDNMLNFDIFAQLNQTPVEKDPDESIMMPTEEIKYKNDKKLSEILSEANKYKVDSIFDNTTNINLNFDVDKNDVQIETDDNSEDELSKIMKKLSSMSNNEDDNYTNIF